MCIYAAGLQEVEEDDDNNHNVDDYCDFIFEGTFKLNKHMSIYFQKAILNCFPLKGRKKISRVHATDLSVIV